MMKTLSMMPMMIATEMKKKFHWVKRLILLLKAPPNQMAGQVIAILANFCTKNLACVARIMVAKNFIEFVKQYADFNDTDIEEQKVNSKLCLKLSDYTNPILYSS